jgi:hypothetical protein
MRPGTVGPVSVHLRGYDLADETQTKVAIPHPVTDSGDKLPQPKT